MAVATLLIPRESDILRYLDVTDEERNKMSEAGFEGMTDAELAELATADEDRWHDHSNNYMWDMPW